MAATTGTSSPITSINVTPFVDVVLVLLIIFMATSGHIATPVIEVDLPQAASGGEALQTSLSLVLTKTGQLYLNGELSEEQIVADACRAASRNNPKEQVIIAADGASSHSQVVRLIDLVKLNGINRFALNIDLPSPTTAAERE